MNLVLLVALISAVLFPSLLAFKFAEKVELPPLLSSLVLGCFLVFLGSLIPGAVGAYAPLPVALFTIALSLCVARKLVALKVSVLPELSLPLGSVKNGPWSSLTLLVTCAAVALCYPYALCFGKLLQIAVSPRSELGWDTVSYHLPALAEYIQAHSLWSFQGPYQSYSYGFELIYGLSMLFCHSHWGVVWGHGASVLLLVLSVAFITNQLLDVLQANGALNINQVMVQLLVQALWVGVLFATSLDGVGNNDIFEAATLLATFGFMLVPWCKDVSQLTLKVATLLGSLSFCMALATKSPALLFAPLFVLMAVGAPSTGGTTIRRSIKGFTFGRFGYALSIPRLKFGLPLLIVAGFVGTFFLWHNVSFFGGITDPALAVGFRDTLLHHLRDPRLFKPTLSSIVFFASAINLVFVWKLWKVCYAGTQPSSATAFVWLAGLFIFGMAAFSYTPFGVTPDYDHNDLTRLFFQDRKAMVMYMAVSLSLSLAIGVLIAKFAKMNAQLTKVDAAQLTRLDAQQEPVLPRLIKVPASITVSCFVIVIATVPILDWWWHREYPVGLPGYDVVKALPRTEVYEWVQFLDRPTRIYSSGLRPYGLLGRDYQNLLFYDLHSHILKVEKEQRLLSVLDQFNPDIVLISVDPHAYTGGPTKPELVEWMKKQPCFVQVYEDETVTGFRVAPSWRDLLRKYKLPDTPVRMHS